MEDLRQELNEYLKARGTTLRWISQQTGIEYYALSKFKTNKRDLPEKWIESLTNLIHKA